MEASFESDEKFHSAMILRWRDMRDNMNYTLSIEYCTVISNVRTSEIQKRKDLPIL